MSMVGDTPSGRSEQVRQGDEQLRQGDEQVRQNGVQNDQRDAISLLAEASRHQKDSIDTLGGAFHDFAVGLEAQASALNKRPTLFRTIVIVIVMSLVSSAVTVGIVWERTGLIRSGQASGHETTVSTNDLVKKINDCLDNTTADGTPIGQCAAESNARFTQAVEQVVTGERCNDYEFFASLADLNPNLNIKVPPKPTNC